MHEPLKGEKLPGISEQLHGYGCWKSEDALKGIWSLLQHLGSADINPDTSTPIFVSLVPLVVDSV